MKKATLIKLLCLALACLLLAPMIIACGEEEDESSTTTTTEEEVETVFISFNRAGGYFTDGEDEVEIEKGTKLRESKLPEVEKEGYVFVCWSYTKGDADDAWDPSDKFRTDTVLYAVWAEEGSGNTPGGNTPGGDETTNKVTIEYNTGTGYFENVNDYEQLVVEGGRVSSHPTPVHSNPAMKFDNWYKDPTFTTPMSYSDKYEANTTLYAKWVEQTECVGGGYNHEWGSWDMDKKPDCVKAGTVARYCNKCNSKETATGDPALGHLWGTWTESFMRMERACGRLGCTEKDIRNYENVTTALLGNNPNVKGDGQYYSYANPVPNLYNGNWDEDQTSCFAGKGQGDISVTAVLATPSSLDRIYFKGRNGGTVNVYVQYEGESDFTRVGSCSFVTDAENSKPANERLVPYVTVDNTKNIVSIKFEQKEPPNGTSLWEEFAFVRVATEE